MNVLVALGYIEQCPNRKYRLGSRMTDLGMLALNSPGLRQRSHPYLECLRQRSTFTVSLSVLDGSEILYVDRARSFRRGQYMIDLNIRLGSRLPAYCTSMGKALMAYLPDGDRQQLLDQIVLDRRGPNTVGSITALRCELEDVSKEGIAISDEELAPGLISIAVPIWYEGRGVVAAVSIAAHTSMISLEHLIDQLAPSLKATASRISALLGDAMEY